MMHLNEIWGPFVKAQKTGKPVGCVYEMGGYVFDWEFSPFHFGSCMTVLKIKKPESDKFETVLCEMLGHGGVPSPKMLALYLLKAEKMI